MTATLVVRHTVNDYAEWHSVYEGLEPLRVEHGCTDKRVFQAPGDANDVLVTHDFPSVEQAGAFAHDPALRAGMERAGVAGDPRIEIFEVV
jgi:hypothetical protein